MTTALNKVEATLVGGDLSKLTPEERTTYYLRVCESLGLNPLTKPFEYITLNNKLTLYARKDCTDQLRKVHSVSITEPSIKFEDEWIVVSVTARLPDGRTDSDVGLVNKKDMRGDFGNAVMKAVTKAKRRVTLSICGLGMLDETEVETIPDAKPIQEQPAPQLPPKAETPDKGTHNFERFGKLIQAAQTLDDFRMVMASVNAQIKTAGLTGEQNKQLAALAKARKDKLASEDQEPDEPTVYVGRDLAQHILDACTALGIDWSDVTDNHGPGTGLYEIAGITPYLEVKVTELSAQQGLRLHEELKRRLAERKAGKEPVTA
jgi:hypothetical protein